jgi:hypothetical protein
MGKTPGEEGMRMTGVADDIGQLADTDGFLVESPAGAIGRVEQVWLGERDEPCALAVQTIDGRHALLLGEDVVTVDREQRWVVVPPEPMLLELAPTRLTGASGVGRGARLSAAWATTGSALPELARGRWRWPRHQHPTQPATGEEDWPLLQALILLYASLALIVAAVITLAFLVARLVTGAAS